MSFAVMALSTLLVVVLSAAVQGQTPPGLLALDRLDEKIENYERGLACKERQLRGGWAVQGQTPPGLLGKVLAFIMAVSNCAAPVGQAVYGALFESCPAWAVLRDYDGASLGWVELIKCMRSAGVGIEALPRRTLTAAWPCGISIPSPTGASAWGRRCPGPNSWWCCAAAWAGSNASCRRPVRQRFFWQSS